MTGKDVLPEKKLLEKAAKMKRFEYLPLGRELKPQTDIGKKQYQKLDDTYEFDKIIKKDKPTFEKYNRSHLIYSSKYSFYGFTSFYNELNKFYSLKPQKESTKEKKVTVYDNASGMYYVYVETYFDQ